MISLVFPNATAQEFIDIHGFAVPLGTLETALVDFTSESERISEARGIYGENFVRHHKFDGVVTYAPSEAVRLVASTPRYPCQISLPLSGGGLALYRCGLLSSSSAWYFDTSLTLRFACVVMAGGVNPVIRIVAGSILGPGSPMSFTDYHVHTLIRSGESVIIKWTRRRYLSMPGSINWGTVSLDYLRSCDTSQSYVTTKEEEAVSGISNIGYSSLPTPSIASSKAAVEKLCRKLILSKFEVEEYDYGVLAGEAVNSMDVIDTNMISFIKDLGNPKALIPSLLNLKKLKGLRKADIKALKEVSNSYLSVKYGILPTVSDLKEIVSAFDAVKPYIDKNGFKTYSAGHQTSSSQENITYELEQRLKLALANEDRGLLALTDALDKFGVMPNFSNIWDLIPYTFALDWFIDVGSLLERVDTDLRLSTLDIKYVTMSKKKTTTMQLSASDSSPFSGQIQLVQYHRWVSDHCPVPRLSLQSPITDFNHWLESAALLIQRRKH